MTAHRAHLLDPRNLDRDDLDRWRALADGAVEANPFFEPEFVVPAFERLKPRGGSVLVTANAQGEWTGCLTVHRPLRWRRVPAPALAAWRHPYSYVCTPLLRRDDPLAPARALIRELLDRSPALVGFELLPAEGPAMDAIRAAVAETDATPIVYESFERASVRRSADEPLLGINRKHQRELARMGRRLGEELGEAPVTRDRAGDPQAVERFLSMEAEGWKGRNGTAFASIEGHADLFRHVCASFAARERLELLSLEAGGDSVAMKVNLLADEWKYCFKIAFAERWSRFSPGIQLELANLKMFEEGADFENMDSCAEPENPMINRLWTGRRTLEAVAVPVPGLRAPLLRRATMFGARSNRKRKELARG